MKNRHVMPAIAGASLVLVTLLFFSAAPLLGTLQEDIIIHIVGLTVVAFLALIGYEDWKDAQRERLNNGDGSHPC